MRVLVVEDDAELAGELVSELAAAGYAVDWRDNGQEAQYAAMAEPYDAVILDLGLPGRSGLEVLRQWREAGLATAVIILTARDAWHEKVRGFRAGADDYLAKPFHMAELIERLRAVLRRRHGRPPSPRLEAEGLTLDEERQCVRLPAGQEVALTGTEFRLLRYFMLHPGQLLSKSRLAGHLYAETDETESNVIEVYVNRLRAKLGAELIRTQRGQGYVFGHR